VGVKKGGGRRVGVDSGGVQDGGGIGEGRECQRRSTTIALGREQSVSYTT